MKLNGQIVQREQLTQDDINRMYELMNLHYDGINIVSFKKDLSEKDWVIILINNQNEICGFSTQKVLNFNVEGKSVRALFSGDTIIHKDYWGELELPKMWLKLGLHLLEKYPNELVYWILITKGYKTYKFLPIYFNNFYPRRDCITPRFEKNLIDTFGEYKYPYEYDAETGVIRFEGKKDRVKEGIADITEQKLKHPDVRFFAEKNPGYKQGDELVCVTQITTENLSAIAKRFILKGLQ